MAAKTTKGVLLELPVDIHHALKVQAAAEGLSLRALIVEVCRAAAAKVPRVQRKYSAA